MVCVLPNSSIPGTMISSARILLQKTACMVSVLLPIIDPRELFIDTFLTEAVVTPLKLSESFTSIVFT